MRNVGSCQWSLFGRLLMFAMRNAHRAEARRTRRIAILAVRSARPAA